MNLPNKITLVRILLIPLFVVLFLVQFPFHYLAACIVFIVASITDFIDGNIARRRNLVTNLGKFLDPFADKALVCTALVLITSFSNIFTFAIVIFTVIIIVRELMITAFRTVAATKKVILAADIWGKIKTSLQMTGLIIYMLYPDFGAVLPILGDIAMYAGFICLALATVFAIISAFNYIIKNAFVLSDSFENSESLCKKIISSSCGTIAVAESFTGGNICADLVSVPGASKHFIDGKVCYSDDAKIKELNVSSDIIAKYGPVSTETATGMLNGLKQSIGADYCVITTGNAGPTAEKGGDVGECYIGIAGKKVFDVQKFVFKGNRAQIIESGTKQALLMLYDAIQLEKNKD